MALQSASFTWTVIESKEVDSVLIVYYSTNKTCSILFS